MSDKGWELVRVAGHDSHVLPVGDIIAHCESRTCQCGPSVDYSSNVPMVVHHAADLRELSEPDHVQGKYDGTVN